MQVRPFGFALDPGLLKIIVQVLPSLLVSTSIKPPLLVMPKATGSSWYLSLSRFNMVVSQGWWRLGKLA